VRDRDPDHWLYRLLPDEWLGAAEGELAAARRALEAKQQRAGVTQSRRAAGMAWNAVLAATEDEAGYGRSYMDHLRALAGDPAVPDTVRVAAARLLAAPLSPEVVHLGKGSLALAHAAEVVVAHARERLAPTAKG
jgi:HEPN domain-containing protein